SERAGENSASPGFTRQLGPEIIFPHHGPGLDYRDFTGKPTPEMLRAAAATLMGHADVQPDRCASGSYDRDDRSRVTGSFWEGTTVAVPPSGGPALRPVAKRIILFVRAPGGREVDCTVL